MKRLLYYLRLYFAFVAYSLNRELQFRTNFVVIIFGYILYLSANLALFGVLYQWINNLGDWSFNQVLIFIGTYHTIHGFWDACTALNLDRIPQYVSSGDLDLILIKPVNSLFFVIFRNTNFAPLINVILGLVLTLMGVVATQAVLGFSTVLLYLLLSLNGIIIFSMIQLLVQLIAFKVIRTNMINSLFYQFIKFAEKPDVIYTGAMRLVFTFVFPVLIIVNIPSRLFMGKVSWQFVLYDFLVTGILLLSGIGAWKLALRSYSSASS